MQFIPRLSSTSINNKHLHKTRASLRGWMRHRPARSTSDETLCLLGLYRTLHLLSTRLVFSCWDPSTIFTYAFSYLSKLQRYQLWQRRLSAYGGGREHLWLMTRDRRSRPRFLCVFDAACFFPSAGPASWDWCLVQHCDMTWCRGGRVGLLTYKYCAWW